MAKRICIVGCGGISGYHRNGFVAAGAGITALVDTDINRLYNAAHRWGVDRAYCYSSVTEMLAAVGKDIDAVSVITPNCFHAPIAIECLQAGKHVYVEKPPAMNAEEFQRMIDAAKANNVLLVPVMNNRARSDMQDLKRRALRGDFGLIESAEVAWRRPHGIPGLGGAFTSQEISGGGAGIDLAPHILDLALWFMGHPKPWTVLAFKSNSMMTPDFIGNYGLEVQGNGESDVESSLKFLVTFEDGRGLICQTSWAEGIKREYFQVAIQGSRGGANISRVWGKDGIDSTAHDSYQIFSNDNGSQVVAQPVIDVDPKMGRELAAMNFVQAISGQAEPLTKPEEALMLMKIIDAAYTSAKSNMAVNIDV
ncbi:MAG: Gfo/Idh/MocA family oxidoreductase [Patescibacteria group bacterium]